DDHAVMIRRKLRHREGENQPVRSLDREILAERSILRAAAALGNLPSAPDAQVQLEIALYTRRRGKKPTVGELGIDPRVEHTFARSLESARDLNAVVCSRRRRFPHERLLAHRHASWAVKHYRW